MIGRFATRTREIEIAGTADELRQLSISLRSGNRTGTLTELSDPAPYDVILTEWRVQSGTTLRVTVLAGDRALVLAAATEALDKLAENIEVLASGARPEHLHIEYYPDHPFVDQESWPLVITLVEEH